MKLLKNSLEKSINAYGGSTRYEETDEEGLEVYEMYPVFPKYEFRLYVDDLEGCTITLSSEDRF